MKTQDLLLGFLLAIIVMVFVALGHPASSSDAGATLEERVTLLEQCFACSPGDYAVICAEPVSDQDEVSECNINQASSIIYPKGEEPTDQDQEECQPDEDCSIEVEDLD